MAIKYVALQVLAWATDFFRSWYAGGFQAFSGAFIRFLKALDRVFALRVSAKNILKPMYQDRSIIGYFFGFIFRLVRIVIASVVYLALGAMFIFAFIVWSLIPPYFLVKALNINVYSLL